MMPVEESMQGGFSFSGHAPTVTAAAAAFTGGYDFAPSLYPSLFLDHLNDGSAILPPREADDTLSSYLPLIQQQQLYHDLADRHDRMLSQFRDVAKQAHDLRQENVNLRMTILDLNDHLSMLLSSIPLEGFNAGSDLDAVVEGLRRMNFWSDEGTSETEAGAKSPKSVMDSGQSEPGGPERGRLPKSISIRSSGYLKALRAAESCVQRGASVKALNQSKFDRGMQKVYVKGGKKEQPLELEVYNQGMFKTELCNKWQQTGTCPYGTNCQFAHGFGELRPVLRHPRYKTEVCRMVLSGIPCPYGHRCHFRHALTDQEQLTRTLNSSYH